MQDYLYATRCRQQLLSEHFGESDHPGCGHCDVCRDHSAVRESVEGARRSLRQRRDQRQRKQAAEDAVSLNDDQLELVIAFIEGMRKPLGKRMVALGLRGSRSKAASRKKLADNPQFGVLRGVPEGAVVRGIEILLAEGRLAPRGKKYPTVWIPDKRVRPPRDPNRPPRNRSNDPPLKAALKRFRRNHAAKRRLAAYKVFSNRTLDELCGQKPRSIAGLQTIFGMGPKRIARYGQSIVSLIQEHGHES